MTKPSEAPDKVSAPMVLTHLGEMFDVFNPEPYKIHIRDIAHALSMICRYGGHTRQFYSVAEHCVLLANYFAARGEHDLARAALLHDATEAYMGDIVRPLKERLPFYVETEDNLQRVIFSMFGLPPEIPLEVKQGDLNIVRDEKTALLPDVPWGEYFESLPLLGVDIHAWAPHEAEEEWINAFWRLF